MTTVPSFTLNTGAKIPSVGLGTWKAGPGVTSISVAAALQMGYRHLDCAYAYGNESEVGEGIKASGIPREEIFVTTKLWGTYHTRVEEGLDTSLKSLGLDYVDLYLIHWPAALNQNGNDPTWPTRPDGMRDVDFSWTMKQTWQQMEAVFKTTTKARAIGVSNWSISFLEDLLSYAEIVPACNQIELHPYNPQHELVEFCKSKGIICEAYSPLGSSGSPMLTDDDIVKIAEKHRVGAGTVLISYNVVRGVVTLPKSVTPSRIKSNLEIIQLDEEDMATLNGLAAGGKQKRFNLPKWPFDLKFDNWF